MNEDQPLIAKAQKAELAQLEKSHAARTSVYAAVGLTGFKLLVGVISNSLGILSEAAHSGLDLVAAIVTLLAVRVSSRPADDEHLYGHGKIENLSALFETLLLLATCVWIISEAIDRLFVKSVEVDPSVWTFIVMATSIVIDYNRSRLLYRTARKYHSQALEADALHFHTDIWSSSVVIFGLIGVLIGRVDPALAFLKKADAVAALGVAVIVVWVSGQLGKRTIMALLDTAPQGLRITIKKTVEEMSGVCDCHKIRVRTSGHHLFVDAHVLLDHRQTLQQAHDLTDQIEAAIQQIAPEADVTVHPEPDVVVHPEPDDDG